MKCNNCNTDNIVNDAVHCPNCGAALAAPVTYGNQPAAPQQQYQQQQAPPAQYQQPQYYPQPPMPQRVETVRNVGMTEILFLISGVFLICAGFGNLSIIGNNNVPFQYLFLGMIALVAGLFILGMMIMPNMVKGMSHEMGLILLGISALFFFWGMAALFADNVGWYGAEIVAASFAGLAGAALKMGLVK
jgi:hypothetical protein